MLQQLSSHANFSVDDMEAAKDFYVNKLGFVVHKELESGLVLESPSGSKVNIYAKDDHEAWNATVLGIEVEDVSRALDDLAAEGVDIEKLPGTDEDGVMHDPDMGDAAWFKDPAGNWICLSTTL